MLIWQTPKVWTPLSGSPRVPSAPPWRGHSKAATRASLQCDLRHLGRCFAHRANAQQLASCCSQFDPEAAKHPHQPPSSKARLWDGIQSIQTDNLDPKTKTSAGAPSQGLSSKDPTPFQAVCSHLTTTVCYSRPATPHQAAWPPNRSGTASANRSGQRCPERHAGHSQCSGSSPPGEAQPPRAASAEETALPASPPLARPQRGLSPSTLGQISAARTARQRLCWAQPWKRSLRVRSLQVSQTKIPGRRRGKNAGRIRPAVHLPPGHAARNSAMAKRRCHCLSPQSFAAGPPVTAAAASSRHSPRMRLHLPSLTLLSPLQTPNRRASRCC
mmetsp:Transcript_10602/g.19616  ORF Transcript_10602/g.19616 Transcript_10602/m.19616 type:complete len:329 (+) Transcript_10602:517-1503(+)